MRRKKGRVSVGKSSPGAPKEEAGVVDGGLRRERSGSLGTADW